MIPGERKIFDYRRSEEFSGCAESRIIGERYYREAATATTDRSIDRSVEEARVDDRALIINPYNRRFKGGTNPVGGSRSYASRRCGIELAMVKIDFSIKSFATLVTRPAKLPGTSSCDRFFFACFLFYSTSNLTTFWKFVRNLRCEFLYIFCPRLYTNFFFLFFENRMERFE